MVNIKRTYYFKKGNKINVGRTPWNKGKKGLQIAWIKGKHWSKETKKKISASRQNIKLKEWKGFISPERKRLYFTKEYQNFRSSVFQRDNWTCQTCGKRGCYLEVHHIKEWCNYPEQRFDVNNGVTLCQDCHNLTKKGRGKLQS